MATGGAVVTAAVKAVAETAVATAGVGVDDLAAVALDAQRDTSTSTVGLGVDAVARTAGYLFSRTPWSQSTAL